MARLFSAADWGERRSFASSRTRHPRVHLVVKAMSVPSATSKLPEIRRNPAEAPQVENAMEPGISVEKTSKSLDRKISVAPVMDWTDDL
jgi:hypothetical protein